VRRALEVMDEEDDVKEEDTPRGSSAERCRRRR